MSDRPTVICLTPIKNEAWILDRFLTAASLWADHVILADQGSVDDSREIAVRHPKVTLVRNQDSTYDEGRRQELLLREARRIPGKRVIMALDADEALTGNWRDTEEWDQLLSAPTGTVFNLYWANMLPGWTECWIPSKRVPFGFVDDGREHSGPDIHSTRIPTRVDAPVLDLLDIKVLHLQYTDWDRMKSKQRWYQCWERIHSPDKRPIQIYRQYHNMDAISPTQIWPVDDGWLAPYLAQGIDFSELVNEDIRWPDREILEWFRVYGTRNFRRFDLWDVDWSDLSRCLALDIPAESLQDPRTRIDRAVHRWLRRTQGRQMDTRVRLLQRLLIPLGW